MKPKDFAVVSDQCRARELQDIAMLLESPLEADGTSGCLRSGPAPAPFGSREEDAPPVSAFETHGSVTLALRVRNADGLDAVTSAEAGHFRGSPLHNATNPDAALGELREGLTQLREGFRIERSAEMSEPEDERRAFSPQFGESMPLAGSCREREFGNRIADGWRNRHVRSLPGPQLSYCGLQGRATGARTRTVAKARWCRMRPG